MERLFRRRGRRCLGHLHGRTVHPFHYRWLRLSIQRAASWTASWNLRWSASRQQLLNNNCVLARPQNHHDVITTRIWFRRVDKLSKILSRQSVRGEGWIKGRGWGGAKKRNQAWKKLPQITAAITKPTKQKKARKKVRKYRLKQIRRPRY